MIDCKHIRTDAPIWVERETDDSFHHQFFFKKMFLLFQEIRFYLHGNYSERDADSLKELIVKYGGQLVTQQYDAHLQLVLEMSQELLEHATHLPFHISPMWICFCIQKKTLVEFVTFFVLHFCFSFFL